MWVSLNAPLCSCCTPVPWKPPLAGPPAMPNAGCWKTFCTARLKRKSRRSLVVQLWLIFTSNDVGFLRSCVLTERLLVRALDCECGTSARILCAIGLNPTSFDEDQPQLDYQR